MRLDVLLVRSKTERTLLTSFVCQTPVSVQLGDLHKIEIHYADGSSRNLTGQWLDEETSQHVFQRDGSVKRLVVTFMRNQ